MIQLPHLESILGYLLQLIVEGQVSFIYESKRNPNIYYDKLLLWQPNPLPESKNSLMQECHLSMCEAPSQWPQYLLLDLPPNTATLGSDLTKSFNGEKSLSNQSTKPKEAFPNVYVFE